MDAIDQAFREERAWLLGCDDVHAILDKMASYRGHLSTAERTGNVKGYQRVSDLLEIAEERIAVLKAARLSRPRAAPAREEPPPRRDGAARSVSSGPWTPAKRQPDPHRDVAPSPSRNPVAVVTPERRTDRQSGTATAREQAFHMEPEFGGRAGPERGARSVAQDERPASPAVARPKVPPQVPRQEPRSTVPPTDRPAPTAPEPAAGVTVPIPAPAAAVPPLAGPAPGAASQLAPAEGPVKPPVDREPASYTGADLAATRRSLGLRQTEFATRLGVTQGTVSKAEGNPKAVLGAALQEALGRLLGK